MTFSVKEQLAFMAISLLVGVMLGAIGGIHFGYHSAMEHNGWKEVSSHHYEKGGVNVKVDEFYGMFKVQPWKPK